MKKLLIISSFFLIIISFSMVGYHVVSANEKVEETRNEITYQRDQEIYLTPYGYTLDNPNIVLNPYGTTPLTAIILFETEKEEEVSISILGKDEETTINHKFDSTKNHIIPIYGLYPNIENKIEIECGKIKKTYTIKTEPLPKEITSIKDTPISERFTISQSNGYIYALDKNRDIRWLYKNNTEHKPYLLENGNLLVTNSITKTSSNLNILMEIDLMGKIYKQYHLENDYTGLLLEKEDSLFIVTKNLIELDKQTGVILNTYQLDQTYEQITLDDQNNNIILLNKKEKTIINQKTKKHKTTPLTREIISNNSPITIIPYINKTNYKFIKGIKFENQIETPTSEKNIFLIGYHSPDKNYKKYNIKIQQTEDNIQISGEFSTTDKVYIILDKFLDKRIYDLENNNLTINQKNLSGKYSIYIKINKTIYKTNTFVNF